MAKCGFCGSTIVIGGVRSGDRRYCNKKCQQNAYILSLANDVPAQVLNQKVEEVWRGPCGKCGGVGPNDVHKVYQVWSALALTRWSTRSQVSCRSCAMRAQLGGVAFSFFLGWWGIPWGLILTPVQISRNLAAIARRQDESQPSADLRKLVMVNIAAQRFAAQKSSTSPSPNLSR